ncbi:hypothetical protein GCM10027046_21650 [Uliginosibacterium flavum]|uniref:Spy/CpxP family protein refolding chaperone n=1 Tax=Uliginosibacterium flavum TaxID=1396831 RepID=A0ABV2TQN6_9RHOO
MTQTHSTIRRFLTVSALALAVPLSALAQTPPAASAPAAGAAPMQHGQHGHRGHHGRADSGMRGGHMFMLRGLDLSAAQQEQVKTLFEAQRPAFEEKSKAVREARNALHLLVSSGKYTPERANELTKDIAQKESVSLLFMAEQGNKLMQILTPEQRTKLQARMQEKSSTRGRMHGGRF